MKKKFRIISGLAVAIIAAAALSFNSTASAQADNPHLRRHQSPTPGKGGSTTESQLSQQDQHFLVSIVSANEEGIQEAMVAEKKAEHAETKRIASRIMASHQQMNKELRALAKKKGLAITTGNIAPRDMGTKNYEAQYLYTIETDHRVDLKDFNQELKNGKDPEIKAWAAQHMPTVKEHMEMARKARKDLK